MHAGTFITVEGPNFSGKSTFMASLVEHFRRQGRETLVFREPGGSAYGETMRPTLKGAVLTDFARALGFNSVRAQNIEEIVTPALAKGMVVFADRYLDSTSVYQIEMGRMTEVQRHAVALVHAAMLQPDLTIFLLPSVELVRARSASRQGEIDVYESTPDLEVAAYRYVAAKAQADGRSVISIEYDEASQDRLFEMFLANLAAQMLKAA